MVVDGKTGLSNGSLDEIPGDGGGVTVTVRESETVMEMKSVTVGAGACGVLGSKAV